MNPIKRILIVTVTFISGSYYFLEFLLPASSGFGTYHEEISKAVQVVGSMAIGLGVINILRVHGMTLIKRSSGWLNSFALLIGFFFTLTVQCIETFSPSKEGFAPAASQFITEAFFIPLGSAMFSLLAFYIVQAAYRSFRVKNKESALMITSALIVMLGQIPFGVIYISEDLPDLRRWLLLNISTPAFRAIYFGSALAGLSMAIRMWLSLEKSPLDEDSADK
jgi:hypothetical protein